MDIKQDLIGKLQQIYFNIQIWNNPQTLPKSDTNLTQNSMSNCMIFVWINIKVVWSMFYWLHLLFYVQAYLSVVWSKPVYNICVNCWFKSKIIVNQVNWDPFCCGIACVQLYQSRLQETQLCSAHLHVSEIESRKHLRRRFERKTLVCGGVMDL